MAIYKLGEIGIFKGGISSLDKSKYDSGILFVNYMDVFKNSYIDQYAKLRKYDASKNDIKKYSLSYGDALFTASSETPNEIAISSIYLSNKNAIFNGFCKRFKYNHLILMPKYASYYFRSKNFRKEAIKYSTGYTRFNISQKNLEEIQIRIPCLKIQKQIIDIIKPIEKLIFLTKSIIKIITNWYSNKQIMEAKDKKIKDICLNISNGFPYQKKHIDVKGVYKIFTIKNIKNSKNFSRTNFICNNKILVGDVVTGLSGTIGTTKIMDCKKWVSNQRTLTINSKYFLEIKSTIEINMLKLLKIARGAAQKNISHFEILDLDISIKNYNHNISNMYLIMLRIINLAKKIRRDLIELLIK